MNRILLLMLSIAGLLLITSCSDDEPEMASLSLSQNSVVIKKDAAEANVVVTTNQNDWSATSLANWMEVSRNGSILKIKAAKNTTVDPRKGKILLIAGSANATIEVTQEGVPGNIVLSDNAVVLEQHAGTVVIDVTANDKEWTAVTDADWITLKLKQRKYELHISYTKNTERAERIAKIFITAGDRNKELLVTQKGILFFLLPFDEVGSDVNMMLDFEMARKSLLIRHPDGNNNTSIWDFRTRSALFPEVRYALPDNSLSEMVTFADKELLKKELAEFEKYLIKNGYEKRSNLLYENAEKELEATINTDEGYIYYAYNPSQDKAYPTFKKFPYGFIEWGAKKDKIDAYEADNKGTINNEYSIIADSEKSYDFLFYDVKDQDEEKPMARGYWVYHEDKSNPGLLETAMYFEKTDLVFFKAGDGTMRLTREFKELCQKEGFEFVKFEEGTYGFANRTKGLSLTVAHVKYSIFENPVLDLHLYQSVVNNSNSSNLEKLLQNMHSKQPETRVLSNPLR